MIQIVLVPQFENQGDTQLLDRKVFVAQSSYLFNLRYFKSTNVEPEMDPDFQIYESTVFFLFPSNTKSNIFN